MKVYEKWSISMHLVFLENDTGWCGVNIFSEIVIILEIIQRYFDYIILVCDIIY